MPSGLLNDAAHWRARAEEMREFARNVIDQDAKKTMLRIADDYEDLPQRADGRKVEATIPADQLNSSNDE